MTHLQAQSQQHGAHRSMLIWELVGIILIISAGASLHFVFAWTGYWRPAGLIAAVNESTWEHFKIAFWPAFFYALIEYPFLRTKTRNFAVAKGASFLTMPLVTAALFYGYTAITGHHYLLVDILIFCLSVIAGQAVSYRILASSETASPAIRRASLALIALFVIAFSLLSYFPPHNFLFRHPESDEYGILESYEDHDHESGPNHEP